MPPTGFQLGDHTFLHPTVSGPVSRFKANKRQILGALPPTVLQGIVREATPQSPSAKDLFEGKFCGHGEPAMTIFDIIIDAADELEIAAFADDDTHNGANMVVLAARAKDSDTPFRVIFRRDWEDRAQGLAGIGPQVLTQDQLVEMGAEGIITRMSVGFEYPCDAQSRDEVSWMTIDLLDPDEQLPRCVVDAEMM